MSHLRSFCVLLCATLQEFAMEPVSGALTSSSSTTSRPGRRGRGRRGLSETSSSTPSRGGRRRRGGDDSEPPSSSGGTIGLGSSTLRSSGDPGSSSAGDHLRTENFFWGSSVSVQAVQESFRRFLQDFREPPNTTGGDEVWVPKVDVCDRFQSHSTPPAALLLLLLLPGIHAIRTNLCTLG